MKANSKYQSAFADNKTIRISIVILVIIAIGFILHLLQAVFKPLFIAIVLSYVFEPLVKLFHRLKIPKAISIILVLIITFVFFYIIGLILYSNINALTLEFPKYEAKFNKLYLSILDNLQLPQQEVNKFYDEIDWGALLEKLSLPSILSTSVGSFFNFIANLFLILLFTVYIMLGRENLVRNISLAFPGKRSDTIIRMMENINRGIQKYFLVKTLISLGIGLLATLVLIIFDVDFAWVWGLLTFLLNFIPNIGAVIATIPPILVAIFQYGGFLPAIWIALILSLSHVIWGNILEPAFMGKSLNISPLVIIISLIFWGYIWGPVGMVLAVPISSTILIFCSNIESLKPISILIAEE